MQSTVVLVVERLSVHWVISKVRPPATKKSFVYSWNLSVKGIQEELGERMVDWSCGGGGCMCVVSGSLHGKYLGAFEDAQAAVNARCIDEMERCRVSCLALDILLV